MYLKLFIKTSVRKISYGSNCYNALIINKNSISNRKILIEWVWSQQCVKCKNYRAEKQYQKTEIIRSQSKIFKGGILNSTSVSKKNYSKYYRCNKSILLVVDQKHK